VEAATIGGLNTYPVEPPQLVNELNVAPDAGKASVETVKARIWALIAFIPFL
jgi:hypothetical protein